MTDVLTDLQEQLQAVRAAYQLELPGKIRVLNEIWHGLEGGHWSMEGADKLHRHLHKLAGSGATFGFTSLSKASLAVEAVLMGVKDAATVPCAEVWLQLEAGIEEVRQASYRCDDEDALLRVAQFPSIHKKPPIMPRIQGQPMVITAAPGDLLPGLKEGLLAFDVDLLVAPTLGEFEAFLEENNPSGLIVDLDRFPHQEGALRELSQRHEWGAAAYPVLALATEGATLTRLKAVRIGADHFFLKPVSTSSLLEACLRPQAQPAEPPFRVLIVEDDLGLAEYASKILMEAGMLTLTVTNPLEVMSPLSDFHPDLLLMDIYMPQCSGAELAQMIRQSTIHGQLPIVFYSVETDLEQQLDALRLGEGDDFLVKPLKPRHLVERIRLRARRARKARAAQARDPLTGALNHSAIHQQLAQELARSKAAQQSMSLVVVNLDGFRGVNERFGHVAGDQVLRRMASLLRRACRPSDTLGRLMGDQFALLLPGRDAGATFDMMEGLRESFSRMPHQMGDTCVRLTLSAGVAAYPAYLSSSRLWLASSQALEAGRRSGPNRVTCAA